MKIEKKRGKDTFICIFMLEYGNRKYGEKHQRKEGNKWIGKKSDGQFVGQLRPSLYALRQQE